MKLPYFPGCALKTTAQNFELSAIATTKELGIDLIELPRWNCCGTVYSLVNNNLMHRIAPLRNLIRVQEMNKLGIVEDEYRLVTLCSICYNTLKRTNSFVKNDDENLQKLNDVMDREEEYKGQVKIVHFLELLKEIGFEKVGEKVRRPLKGIRIAPYYGCLLLRPKKFAIDNPENPRIFEELLEALDVEVIANPYKMQCCGSYQTVTRKNLVVELVYKNLSYAARNGAEAIALSCPLCAFNLDQRQEELQKSYSHFNKMPVFYFTQLMAIALGLSESQCGFELHYVNPKKLLYEKKIF